MELLNVFDLIGFALFLAVVAILGEDWLNEWRRERDARRKTSVS